MGNPLKTYRLKPSVGVELDLPGGQSCSGTTRNVSFGGVFVELFPVPRLQTGDVCRIAVVLDPGGQKIHIPLRSEVVHIQEHGMGFRFLEIGPEHYETFKNFMVANSQDPNALLEELKSKPGIIPVA